MVPRLLGGTIWFSCRLPAIGVEQGTIACRNSSSNPGRDMAHGGSFGAARPVSCCTPAYPPLHPDGGQSPQIIGDYAGCGIRKGAAGGIELASHRTVLAL